HVPDRPPLVAASFEDFSEPAARLSLQQRAASEASARASGGSWTYGAWVCPEPATNAGRCAADYAAAGRGPALEPLTWRADAWNWAWRSERFHSLAVTREGSHPSAYGGRPVWVVRRWTAAAAERLRVSGTVARPAGVQGDGSGAFVLIDGRPAWQAIIGGPGHPERAEFSADVAASPGMRIDFAVTPGPAASIDYDFTEISILVERAATTTKKQ